MCVCVCVCERERERGGWRAKGRYSPQNNLKYRKKLNNFFVVETERIYFKYGLPQV